jgi:hypothetical protein
VLTTSFFFGASMLSSLHGDFAGGGPAAAHFSCLAKKSKQKKATALPLPLRGSQHCERQSGKRNKLAFGSDKFRFFIRFVVRNVGSVRSGNAKAPALPLLAV